MHKHESLILWERKDQKFVDNKYSRAHLWEFDGVTVPASSSPSVLPVPMSSLEAIDPEEALVEQRRQTKGSGKQRGQVTFRRANNVT